MPRASSRRSTWPERSGADFNGRAVGQTTATSQLQGADRMNHHDSRNVSAPQGRVNVLIAGGGVAGLEAAFALRELAGDRARVALLAATDDYVERAWSVGEPFRS